MTARQLIKALTAAGAAGLDLDAEVLSGDSGPAVGLYPVSGFVHDGQVITLRNEDEDNSASRPI